jgi:hypothetical protein
MAQYSTVAHCTGTTSATTGLPLVGHFNVDISGTFSGTLKVQRSFDSGTTWATRDVDNTGTLKASYTAAASLVFHEPEMGVLTRVAMTAYASGTADCRVSQ